MKIIKAQPGKKIYKHNDYYGYINKIQAQATANPEWFWSDSADASEARQWLYDNGAGAVVDEIYRNTPAEIQKTISSRKLSRKVSDERGTQQLVSDIHSAQKNFMDTAGAIGLQSAATTALAVPLVANPIGTAIGIGSGLLLGKDVDLVTEMLSDGKYADFAHFIRNNKDWGQTGNTLSEFLNPGFLLGAKTAKDVSSLSLVKRTSMPLERWTPKMREDWMNFRRKGWDAIQKWEHTKSNYKPRFGTEREIEVVNEAPSRTLTEDMQHKMDLLEWIDAAKKATRYWKSKGSFMGKTSSKPRIILDDSRPTSRSYGGEDVRIGIIENDLPELPKIAVIGHEIGHRNPIFNSRFKWSENMTDKRAAAIKAESPYYWNDYSYLTSRQKSLLKPSIKVNEHDAEFNEGYSDLFGLKTRLFDLYGKTDKYNALDLLRYRLTKEGLNNRFLQQRRGFKRQLDALNESENWTPDK